ncbi:MAG: PAS domain-containing protein, partial [Actinomycetota bacterium]
MTKKNNSDSYLDNLRNEAVKHLKQDVLDVSSLSDHTTESLLHELRVHQVELEMQNESMRETQESLEIEQQRYFELYNLAPAGYISINEAGFITESNLMAATILNTTKSSLINKALSSFIQKEDHHIYYLNKNKLFETMEPQVFELRTAKKSSSHCCVRMDAIAIQNLDGDMVCRIVIFDITQIR